MQNIMIIIWYPTKLLTSNLVRHQINSIWEKLTSVSVDTSRHARSDTLSAIRSPFDLWESTAVASREIAVGVKRSNFTAL